MQEDTFEADRFSFSPGHFARDRSAEPHSLFQGLVQNDWLGVTYMALRQGGMHIRSYEVHSEGVGQNLLTGREVALIWYWRLKNPEILLF